MAFRKMFIVTILGLTGLCCLLCFAPEVQAAEKR